ncbi:hypothetical protein TeGR_g6002 [Tetraparma gracilis]|uniref:NOT2/NOT3/NOT5 C-terminal domain-containing protein n=1 Tax=Tetraparma gracilis TaxID=2962635 RepID=A0ABQ6MZZ6_9STRA|nr:hypothetical protein TeGR_g6002 [Tetraparma gracilis]
MPVPTNPGPFSYPDLPPAAGSGFDLSDFPSLSGPAPPSSAGVKAPYRAAAGMGGPAGSQLPQGPGGAQGHNFKMAKEDFPALGGGPGGNPGGGGGHQGGQHQGGGQQQQQQQQHQHQTDRPMNGHPNNNPSVGGNLHHQNQPPNQQHQFQNAQQAAPGNQQNVPGSNINQQQFRQPGAPGAFQSLGGGNQGLASPPLSGLPPPPGPNSGGAKGPNAVNSRVDASMGGGAAIRGDYGLLGLLSVIRMSDPDRNTLSLGSDLTGLGLQLNSSESLYANFSSPWSGAPTSREPHYTLPMCYYMQPPALKTGHLSKFQLETLFHIFYALPRDVLQAYSAQELYARSWRYHVELKLWFRRATEEDGVPGHVQGQFLYFETSSWERRLFNGSIQNLTAGLLHEDQVRVKFGSA